MFRFDEILEYIHLTGGPGILMNKKTFKVIAKTIREYYIKDRIFSDVSLELNIKKYKENELEKIKLFPGKNFVQDHHWAHEALPLLPEEYHEVTTYHLRSWLKDKNSYNEVLDVYKRLSGYNN